MLLRTRIKKFAYSWWVLPQWPFQKQLTVGRPHFSCSSLLASKVVNLWIITEQFESPLSCQQLVTRRETDDIHKSSDKIIFLLFVGICWPRNYCSQNERFIYSHLVNKPLLPKPEDTENNIGFNTYLDNKCNLAHLTTNIIIPFSMMSSHLLITINKYFKLLMLHKHQLFPVF